MLGREAQVLIGADLLESTRGAERGVSFCQGLVLPRESESVHKMSKNWKHSGLGIGQWFLRSFQETFAVLGTTQIRVLRRDETDDL